MMLNYYVVLLILFLLCYFCYSAVDNLNLLQNHIQDEKNEIVMNLTFEHDGIVNCLENRIPCVIDSQCHDNCLASNLTNSLSCQDGYCSISAASTQDNNEQCDATKGLITVFIASEFITGQLCISTYRDVIDDNGSARPYICDSGVLDVNLLSRPFTFEDCACAPGYTRLLYTQGAYSRPVPVCIPQDQVAIYEKVYQTIAS
ncbi:PIF-3 [Operophtera brumata nucleopolyhedrovirus]|uniref:PIF-3 n=1 Tax=Operophtera brumata nucleopolyhedrovirus TaxID=1046267 RepID=A0A2H4UZV0_9ABAC|nr:PIF-3 [Operophtera brumata nucleopolyhedrovirus]AUA60332.1 PIF-3 [Operophtera brumata nucleopolyhedrovirus]